MVEDYHNRKMAKKKRKREGGDERPEGKRVRSKKNKTRRICRGLCYKEPFEVCVRGKTFAESSEDAADDGAVPEAAPPKPKRRRRQKADSSTKQSTSINLLAASQHDAADQAVNPYAGAAGALVAYPKAIQDYMLDQGLTGPTPVQERELAQQIQAAARPLKKLFGLSSLCLYGGVDKLQQIEALRQQQPHLLVATPGRLLDLIDDEECPLSLELAQYVVVDEAERHVVFAAEHVQYVVLDEADKMLSLGLQPQLKRIRALIIPRKSKGTTEVGAGVLVKPHTRRKRPQVLLFTATMPEGLQEAAAKWQRKPVSIHLAPGEMSISQTITQVVQVCAEHKKPAKLLKHLTHIKDSSVGKRNAPKVLVFANRIKTVRFLQQSLVEAGFKAVQLHGDRSQPEREEAMTNWKSGKAQILVATDVAARGLHIKNLPYVINYDFPTNLDTYIHRVGRTGRLATDGHAYSFFTRNLAPVAQPLLALLKTHNQAVDPNLVRLSGAYTIAAAQMVSATDKDADEASVRTL